jgi:hypothetical protein
MPKLTDTQLVILNKAAQRDDRGVVIPSKLPAGAQAKVVASLLVKHLVREVPKTGDLAAWREKDGRWHALIITDAGLKALNIDDEAETAESKPAKTKGKRKPKASSGSRTREGTKQAQLIDMLKSRAGATIDEIVKAMKWQPHTVRGAIAGALKKKLGLKVTSEKVDGRGRTYRIAG